MTPDQYTNKEFFIEVGNGHQLYVYDWGNKKGLPIIFLHGGPGGAVSDNFKRLFDPTKHRVIFYDQRGCGKSLPYGSLKHNTTQDLVEDVTKIADHLKLKQFVLEGASWGSTLALAYGVKYPKRVKAMVLSGILTGTQREIDYIDKGEFATHYPELWERFLALTPKSHQHTPAKYHQNRILGKDDKAIHESAQVYQNLQIGLLGLDDRTSFISPDDPTYDPTSIRLETHYLVRACFLPDNYIMDNAKKLAMPIWMVQGRYDMVCPPVTAYRLHQKLPNSQLIWTIGGHKPSDRETHTVLRTILLQLAEK